LNFLQTRIVPFDQHLPISAADVSFRRDLPMDDAIVYADRIEVRLQGGYRRPPF